jgi:TPR repeat protein
MNVNMLTSLISSSIEIISSMFTGSLFSLHFIPRYHMEKKAPIHITKEIKVKKILLAMFIILFTAPSVFCGDFENTLKKADKGDAKAQINLGDMFYDGKGVPKDYKKALHWWAKAAEQGNAEAQYNLGWMYQNGKGVPQNYKQAAYWFTKAAEQGDAEARAGLGMLYYEGQGVPKDYKLSYVWFSLATAQGYEEVIYIRDKIANLLLPHQLAEAQDLAAQFHHSIENRQKQ